MRPIVARGIAATLLAAATALGQAGQPNAAYLRALAGKAGLPTLHYTLDLTHPNNHLAGVTLEFAATGPETRVDMPAWYPGRYTIYNFAVNVQQPEAYCNNGNALPFRRADPNTWVIENGTCRQLRWRYRVYGNRPLNGSFFQLDATHANLNGGPVYMYPEGGKPDPVTLAIQAPEGWKVLNELGQPGQTQLWFPNYDIFIDAPTEAAPAFTLDQFQADGKTYRVMIHDYATAASNAAQRQQLLAGLEKIVRAENGVIAPDELDTYTFFFHFDPGSSDGMEHLFGTQIMVPAGLGTDRGLSGAEAAAAHEFFHQWNVKRIRPEALGPWNYEAQNPTPSLWVAEGFTQYYGQITLARTGLEGVEQFLSGLGRSLGSSMTAPGYKLMSAEESSLTAWFHDATPLRQETNQGETSISYYTRGMELATVLDLDIRRRSGGRRSLNDALRWLWQNTYHAPRATYYLPGRGYSELDVRHALEAAAGEGTSYADFFRDYVSGTRQIPYDQYLSAAGLRLQCVAAAGVASFSGLRLAGNEVRGVEPGSPAASAGLGTDMVLESVNGQAAGSDAEALVASLPPGIPGTVVATAHGARLTLTLTPAPPQTPACTLVDLPAVTQAERALRTEWLADTALTGAGPSAATHPGERRSLGAPGSPRVPLVLARHGDPKPHAEAALR